MTDQVTRQRVCVTGAGGYLASWLVKLLLSKGHYLHGTVRNPGDENKNSHLHKLDGAPDNLRPFQADVLRKESLLPAKGCAGVFHVASPLPATYNGDIKDPEKVLIEPAVKGTLNVLDTCVEAN